MLTKCITNLLMRTSCGRVPQIRCTSQLRKRFYKKVSIKRNEGQYEICLDGRPLKTPLGNDWRVNNEFLALAVLNEWQSQSDHMSAQQMHLTALTNTAIDNPNHWTVGTIGDNIMSYVECDTLCFRMDEPKELSDLQMSKWDPIVDWFRHAYHCHICTTNTVQLKAMTESDKQKIYRHLCSHNFWSLIGLLFITENLKSLMLALALTERKLSVNEAVSLSRLEEDFQCKQWGNVEWAHHLDSYVLRSKVSAALLFFFVNCEVRHISQKDISMQ